MTTTALLLLALSTSLLLLLHFYVPPAYGLWTQTLMESLHVPVFGVVAVSLFIATGIYSDWSPVRRALIVVVAAVVLATLSEGAQIPGPRDASFKDIMSDLMGTGAALLFGFGLSRRYSIQIAGRISLLLAGLAISLIALWPLISTSLAYVERNLQRPVLVSFDSRLGDAFRSTRSATLRPQYDLATGKTIGIVTLEEGSWTGLNFNNIWPDWREYSVLVVEFGLQAAAPLKVHLRVHDRAHRLGDQPHYDRFNVSYELQPGFQTLRIPLEQIRNAPRDRKMNLSEIDGIVIFCSQKYAGRQFQLFEIRLE